ncbi:MAG TPA: hypothetical protein VFS55_13340 [Dokdonella sp.]|nr:hypothetical protein [Dokdonella sp.]
MLRERRTRILRRVVTTHASSRAFRAAEAMQHCTRQTSRHERPYLPHQPAFAIGVGPPPPAARERDRRIAVERCRRRQLRWKRRADGHDMGTVLKGTQRDRVVDGEGNRARRAHHRGALVRAQPRSFDAIGETGRTRSRLLQAKRGFDVLHAQHDRYRRFERACAVRQRMQLFGMDELRPPPRDRLVDRVAHARERMTRHAERMAAGDGTRERAHGTARSHADLVRKVRQRAGVGDVSVMIAPCRGSDDCELVAGVGEAAQRMP